MQHRRLRGTTLELEEAAREMRRHPTPAERLLWQALRDRKICGVKFRRQHPLGRTILDFCAPSCRLVIEVDGEIHLSRTVEDEIRTQHLMEYGYRVIRFTNDEVLGNLSRVIARIEEVIGEIAAARQAPTQPFPEDGGGLKQVRS